MTKVRRTIRLLDSEKDALAKVAGEYIVSQKATIRQTAAHVGMSKSTVHSLVTKNLKTCDGMLAKQVRSVLDYNKSQRHVRGGLATQSKYKRS